MLSSVINFFGGIGLFLYGMKLMSDGLELSTGSRLKKLLEVLTTNKFLGVVVGFIITTIIQSSTATTVMIVGFVNAGLMNLVQAVGVIIGANVGTTTTGLIIALNIHSIAPICIFIGAMLFLFFKSKKIKHIGMAIAGFGMLFFGMKVMSDAMTYFSDLPWVLEVFKYAENPLVGLLIGIIITAVVQSSTASIGILLAAMMAGIITDLNQAIFILYGQNLGTCLTAIISSLGSSKMAKKAAMIHLVYNIIGITIFTIITLLPLGFVDLIKSLSDTVSTQFVYTHIIINVIMAILLLPFSGIIIKITEMIIRGKDENKSSVDFKYIDEKQLDNPSLAVVQTYKEVERDVKLVLKNLSLTKNAVLSKSKDIDGTIKKIHENENTVNLLGGRINEFIIKLNSTELEYIDIKLVGSLYRVVLDIERMGNHCINIIRAYEQLRKEKKTFSSEDIEELGLIFQNVEEGLVKAIKIFESGNYNLKKTLEVKAIESKVDIQNEEYKNNNVKRINEGKCDPLSGIVFVKILADLERIADYSCNIAYSLKYKEN